MIAVRNEGGSIYMDNCLQNIGKRIAESRRSAGLTQEELANRLGVTPQAISKWEKGASSPDLMMLLSICEILDVSTDYIVGKNRKKIVENGNMLLQEEIWNHLWDELQPLEIVIGYDVVPVFTDNSFADKVVGLRVELAKESILMPIVRIRDHSRLHSKEVMILAYQNVLYNEELDAVDEKTLDYIVQRLGETVRSKYAEILNVDMIKDLIDSVKITYPTLVESIVPDKLSYGLILDVTRGFLERGNGMVYFPRILEILEHEVRESANASVTELIDAILKRLEREDNFWVVVGKRQR